MKKSSSFKLSSQPENVAQIEDYLRELTDQYNISQSTYANILISLTEAVNNAIHHGNGCDEEKQVHVVHLNKSNDNTLVFRVHDEGTGFNLDDVPDPTQKECLDQEGGRGVYLMRSLSQELNYRDNGSTVEIHFKIC